MYAHEFVWKMYCVPNSARQSVQAHWESVMSRSVLARFVLKENCRKADLQYEWILANIKSENFGRMYFGIKMQFTK